MKRTERHHLKENELQTLAREAGTASSRSGAKRHARSSRSSSSLASSPSVTSRWRERVQTQRCRAARRRDGRQGRAHRPARHAGEQGCGFINERERAQAALTKFKVAADAYPSTDAGLYARYQEAATWLTLGNPAQAAAAYQQVIDKAGNASTARWRGSASPRRRRAQGSTIRRSTRSRRWRSARTARCRSTAS